MIVDSFNALLRALVSGFAAPVRSVRPSCRALGGVGSHRSGHAVGRRQDVGPADNQAVRRSICRPGFSRCGLYQDEPVLLLRAQGHLLVENFRYVRHMLRPALFLALPMVVLNGHFDAVYGRRPLRIGETALLAANTALGGGDIRPVRVGGDPGRQRLGPLGGRRAGCLEDPS